MLRTTALYLLLLAAFLYGCNGSPVPQLQPDNPEPTVLITDVIIPADMPLTPGGEQAVSGKGFGADDRLVFQSVDGEVVVGIQSFTSTYAVFTVPDALTDGTYTLVLRRNEKQQVLGTTRVTLIVDTHVPDRPGATVKGVVYCGTKPLSGVRVSDGVHTVTTDEKGRYWLQSDKYHGYVFICTPSGYRPETTNNATPRFWATLTSHAAAVEQHNFRLIEQEQRNHVILAAADIHLANRGAASNDDMNQFNNGFMVDAKQFIASQTHRPVYALILGDMSWDNYWYSRKYDIANYVLTVSTFTAPMYHVMGNHDNDPYHADDFEAERKYKKALGPTYYATDIGEVHYIFLDNTVFINNGGAPGSIGDRNYDKYLTDVQLNWLKEDLAAIKDKTKPLVVSFHCPSTSNYNALFATVHTFSPAGKAAEFHRCFDAFSQVHFLSGHTHYNGHTTIGNNIREHNIAATCETWWWSGKTSGLNVCIDGSPSGYAVFEVSGRDIRWYYKGIGLERTKQFRTYDMNEVKAFFNRPDVLQVMKKFDGNRDKDYAAVEPNTVLINVWNYEPAWNIEVKENGKALTVERVYQRDPLHTLSYDYPRMRDNGSVTTGFTTNYNPHMFRVVAESASSPLEINVTDRFGNTYSETMARPKPFERTMK